MPDVLEAEVTLPDDRENEMIPHGGLRRVLRPSTVLAAAMLLMFFLIAARMFTWHNGFSYRFHPDEHTKAQQLQSGEYNFYHPQLLFRGAQFMLLARTGAIDGRIRPDEPRDKLEVPLYNRILRNARTASALFGAGAVVLLALVAWWQRGGMARVALSRREGADDSGLTGVAIGASFRRALARWEGEGGAVIDGPGASEPAQAARSMAAADPVRGVDPIRGLAAMLAAGAAIIACSSLLANAHFAKEDAALVLGVAAWVAAGAWYVRRPSLKRAMLFAAACGIVVSGKWIGGVLSVTGLMVIVIAGGPIPRLAPRRGAGLPGNTREREDNAGTLWGTSIFDVERSTLNVRGSRRVQGLLYSALVLVTVAILINAPILWQFDRLIAGLRYEASHVASDHQGLIANAPLYYLEQLHREMGWGLLLLALFELAATAALPGRRRRVELWIAPLAALVLFATISSTKIVNPRYLLPVAVLAHYFAALGALTLGEMVVVVIARLRRVARQLPTRPFMSSIASGALIRSRTSLASGAIALLVLAPTLAPHVKRERGMLAHFAHDRREDLQAWAKDPARRPPDARVLEAIPRDAKVLQEHYVAMVKWPDGVETPDEVPFELHSVRSVAHRLPEEQAVFGLEHAGIRTPEDLAAEGYTHIAIAEDRYARFFDERLGPTPQYRQEYERTRAIYQRLLDEDGVVLIYEYIAPPDRPEWINPTIRIYRLSSAPGARIEQPLGASEPAFYKRCMDSSGQELWTVRRLLEWTSGFLARKEVDSPRLCAELLLAHVLRLPRIQLYVAHDRELSPLELGAFRDLVKRAGEHEPVQYLTGMAHFFGMELAVTPAVLIPRADTETLVEAVLRHLKLATDTGIEQTLRVADLCTGSGAIALALAKRLPNARVIATDISEAAADVARANARRLGLADQLEVRVGEMFSPLSGESPFHVITANPPYIPTGDLAKLDRNVRDYEPRQAMDGGADGLNFHRRLLAGAPDHLMPTGRLFVEMQFDQGTLLRELAEASGRWQDVQVLRDFAGHERVLFARRRD